MLQPVSLYRTGRCVCRFRACAATCLPSYGISFMWVHPGTQSCLCEDVLADLPKGKAGSLSCGQQASTCLCVCVCDWRPVLMAGGSAAGISLWGSLEEVWVWMLGTAWLLLFAMVWVWVIELGLFLCMFMHIYISVSTYRVHWHLCQSFWDKQWHSSH